MSKLEQWFKERKAKENERLRIDGYNYAAGQLLHNGGVMIDHLYAESANPLNWNSFDKGVVEAVEDFRALKDKYEHS